MMNFKLQIETLKKKLNLEIEGALKDKFKLWQELFLSYNSHTNLMSKNDTEVLFEKHVFDSLAVNFWDDFKNCKKILDVGTGGGFPSVILSIFFPEKTIVANDSRIKKIGFIELVKKELELKNLEILYSRIENAPNQKADLILSRAVGKTLDVFELSKKHLIEGGKFLIYKSKIEDEIEDFKKKYKNANFKIIPYSLPLEEKFERNLIIIVL